MPIVEIATRADPRVAVYREVRDRHLRDDSGLFIVEGRLLIRRLVLESRFRVHSLFLTPRSLEALSDLLPKLSDQTPVYVASRAELDGVVGFPMHRGAVAAAERGDPLQAADLLDSPRATPRLLLVLEEVANPDNVGGVFRNARAFGAGGVLLTPGCADPLYRKSVRVSAGASLAVPFARVESGPWLLERMRGLGIHSVALTTDPAAPVLGQLPIPPVACVSLVVGSEGEGLSPPTLAAADARARIAMAPGVDSLNLAMAAGIALHHFSGPGAT